MKVSLIQLDVGNDRDINAAKAKKFIDEAATEGPDIICLPEFFLHIGDKDVEESITSPYIVEFQELAKRHHVNIILGTILLEVGDKNTNSSLVIDRQGEIIYQYDKMYMYDVEKTDLVIHESEETNPGTKIGIVEIDGVRVGIGICVDLRYPEYFRRLIKEGAEVIFLPAHFRKVTGALAWDVLTKARAIENQVYFCACGQTGGDGAKERCGNSRVVSYDGRILSEIETEEGVITVDLNLETMRTFRKEFPALKQMKV